MNQLFFRKGGFSQKTAESTILRLSAIESTRKIWSESEEISNDVIFLLTLPKFYAN